jgi:hypothetical protein
VSGWLEERGWWWWWWQVSCTSASSIKSLGEDHAWHSQYVPGEAVGAVSGGVSSGHQCCDFPLRLSEMASLVFHKVLQEVVHQTPRDVLEPP